MTSVSQHKLHLAHVTLSTPVLASKELASPCNFTQSKRVLEHQRVKYFLKMISVETFDCIVIIRGKGRDTKSQEEVLK